MTLRNIGNFIKGVMRGVGRRAPSEHTPRPPGPNISSLLSQLSPKEEKRLAEFASVRVYGDGETVFEEGMPASAIFLINKGTIRLSRSDDPREELLEEGYCFGVTALIKGLYAHTKTRLRGFLCSGIIRPRMK